MTDYQSLTFFSSEVHENSGAAFVGIGISAGFPSPAEDFVQEPVSLDKILIKNQEATFFVGVSGQSIIDAGINDKDLLMIDRSLEPINNKNVICFINGELSVKRLRVDGTKVWQNPDYPIKEITEENDFLIWGIVTNEIKKV